MCIEGVGGGEGARRGVRHPGGGNSAGGAGEAAPRWNQSESGREWGRTCVCVWLFQSLHCLLVFVLLISSIFFRSNAFRLLVGCRGQAMGAQGQ